MRQLVINMATFRDVDGVFSDETFCATVLPDGTMGHGLFARPYDHDPNVAIVTVDGAKWRWHLPMTVLIGAGVMLGSAND